MKKIFILAVGMISFLFILASPIQATPTYSDNQTNSTSAGKLVLFSVNWSDNTGLSGYIFKFDNCTGTWQEDPWQSFSGQTSPQWSNVTKVINSTVGCTIRWNVTVNDTSNNWNSTDIQSFVTTCEIPINNLYINYDVTLCPGTYNINDTDNNGVIIINAPNVVLECNNTILNGTDYGKGITVNGFSTSTLKGCTIENYYNGVYLYNSDNNTISNNTFTSNSNTAYIEYSDNNTISNNTFTSNAYGILLYMHSDNNTISNNTFNSNNYGIFLAGTFYDAYFGNTIRNNEIRDSTTFDMNYFYSGLYVNTPNNTISYNNFQNNFQSVFFSGSAKNNAFFNNTINTSYSGLKLESSAQNIIFNNIISNNILDVSDSSTNNYSYNRFLYNVKTNMLVISGDREKTINDLVTFNISVFYPNNTACSNFTYDITTRPSEPVTASKTGNLITGNFTVSRSGMYSLIPHITFDENNEIKTKYIYLVNVTNKTTQYYYRYIGPTHFQPSGTDSSSLLLTLPTTSESAFCTYWVQHAVDEIPSIPFGVIRNITIFIRYKAGGTPTLAIQRYATYDNTNYDDFKNITSSSVYTNTTKNFTVNWTMDYVKSWYWFTVKLIGGMPYWTTDATNPSYVNITYNYTDTPQIKSITNKEINVLSATSPPSDTNQANITLEGVGNTNITVQMPNTTSIYNIYFDDQLCDNANCNVSQSNGEINLSLSLGSEHEIFIYNDIKAPTYSNNQTNTTIAGQPCNFTLDWQDNIGLSGYIFSTNNSGIWTNASFVSFSGTSNTAWNVTVLNSTIGTVVAWCFYANDTSNNWNGTSCANPFSYTTTPDNTSPTWSNNKTSPVNQNMYGNGTSQFNVTWTDETGFNTCLIEQNFTTGTATMSNISMTKSGNECYYNLDMKIPKVGTYLWRSFGNDTSNNWNVTDTWTYIVNINTSTVNFMNLTINGTESNKVYNFLSVSNATGWNTGFNGQTITFTLYKNGTSIGTGNPQSEVVQLGAGFYNYTYYTAGNENYTSGTKQFNLTINASSPSLSITSLTSVNYGTSTQTGCEKVIGDSSGVITLLRNGTQVATGSTATINETSITLGAGVYNYTCNYTATQNYTSTYLLNQYRTVNQVTPNVITYINNVSSNYTGTYPFSIEVRGNSTTTLTPPTFNLYVSGRTASGNPAVITANEGGGIYPVIYNTSGNTNYTSASNSTLYLIVNNASNVMNLYFRNTTEYLNQNMSVIYPQSTNFTGICSGGGTCGIFLNDSTTTQNNTSIVRGVGVYKITLNSTGNQNYSSNSTNYYVFVNQNQTNPINIYFINSTGTYANQNITTTYGSTTANVTAIYSQSGTAYLKEDNVDVANPRTTTLSLGLHNYSGNITDNTNYTSNATGATYYITVVDNTPPTYSLNSTNSALAGTPIRHNLNWTDNVALSSYIFSFDNCTGTLANDSAIAFSGIWSNVTKVINSTVGCTIRWCVYANDTSNNWNRTSCDNPFTLITSDGTPPIITIQSPLNQTYSTSSVWVNVTLNEAGSWCGVKNDSSSINYTMTNTTGKWWYQFTGLSQDIHNVRFYCNDTSGNMNGSTSNMVYFTIDTIPPNYSNNATNGTAAGTAVNFTLDWQDNSGLSGYYFSTNNTGTWINSSFVSFSGQSNTSWNVTVLNSTSNTLLQWKFFANDTSNNWNGTSCDNPFILRITDNTPPAYSNNQTNTTLAGQPCNFTLNWIDNVGLSGYIFSTNNTGTWVNSSFVSFSGQSNTSWNVTVLNSTSNTLLQWKFFANDTSNNWNASEIYNLIMTSQTTTTTIPGGGNGNGGGGGGDGSGKKTTTTTSLTSSTTTTIPNKRGRIIHSIIKEIVIRTVSEIKDLIEKNKELKQGLHLAIGKEISEAIKELFSQNTLKIQHQFKINRTLIIDQNMNESTLSLKINYNGNKRIKNLIVYDTIPKNFANSSDSIEVYTEAEVFILNKDPDYLFVFKSLNPEEEKIITYSVRGKINEDIINTTSTPVILAESLESVSVPLAITPTFSHYIILTIIIIFLIIIGTFWIIKKRKERSLEDEWEKLKEKYLKEPIQE